MSSISIICNSDRNKKTKRFKRFTSCKPKDLFSSPSKKNQIGKVIKYYNYFYNKI